jgi:hypothetical protein
MIALSKMDLNSKAKDCNNKTENDRKFPTSALESILKSPKVQRSFLRLQYTHQLA